MGCGGSCGCGGTCSEGQGSLGVLLGVESVVVVPPDTRPPDGTKQPLNRVPLPRIAAPETEPEPVLEPDRPHPPPAKGPPPPVPQDPPKGGGGGGGGGEPKNCPCACKCECLPPVSVVTPGGNYEPAPVPSGNVVTPTIAQGGAGPSVLRMKSWQLEPGVGSWWQASGWSTGAVVTGPVGAYNRFLRAPTSFDVSRYAAGTTLNVSGAWSVKFAAGSGPAGGKGPLAGKQFGFSGFRSGAAQLTGAAEPTIPMPAAPDALWQPPGRAPDAARVAGTESVPTSQPSAPSADAVSPRPFGTGTTVAATSVLVVSPPDTLRRSIQRQGDLDLDVVAPVGSGSFWRGGSMSPPGAGVGATPRPKTGDGSVGAGVNTEATTRARSPEADSGGSVGAHPAFDVPQRVIAPTQQGTGSVFAGPSGASTLPHDGVATAGPGTAASASWGGGGTKSPLEESLAGPSPDQTPAGGHAVEPGPHGISPPRNPKPAGNARAPGNPKIKPVGPPAEQRGGGGGGLGDYAGVEVANELTEKSLAQVAERVEPLEADVAMTKSAFDAAMTRWSSETPHAAKIRSDEVADALRRIGELPTKSDIDRQSAKTALAKLIAQLPPEAQDYVLAQSRLAGAREDLGLPNQPIELVIAQSLERGQNDLDDKKAALAKRLGISVTDLEKKLSDPNSTLSKQLAKEIELQRKKQERAEEKRKRDERRSQPEKDRRAALAMVESARSLRDSVTAARHALSGIHATSASKGHIDAARRSFDDAKRAAKAAKDAAKALVAALLTGNSRLLEAARKKAGNLSAIAAAQIGVGTAQANAARVAASPIQNTQGQAALQKKADASVKKAIADVEYAKAVAAGTIPPAEGSPAAKAAADAKSAAEAAQELFNKAIQSGALGLEYTTWPDCPSDGYFPPGCKCDPECPRDRRHQYYVKSDLPECKGKADEPPPLPEKLQKDGKSGPDQKGSTHDSTPGLKEASRGVKGKGPKYADDGGGGDGSGKGTAAPPTEGGTAQPADGPQAPPPAGRTSAPPPTVDPVKPANSPPPASEKPKLAPPVSPPECPPELLAQLAEVREVGRAFDEAGRAATRTDTNREGTPQWAPDYAQAARIMREGPRGIALDILGCRWSGDSVPRPGPFVQLAQEFDAAVKSFLEAWCGDPSLRARCPAGVLRGDLDGICRAFDPSVFGRRGEGGSAARDEEAAEALVHAADRFAKSSLSSRPGDIAAAIWTDVLSVAELGDFDENPTLVKSAIQGLIGLIPFVGTADDIRSLTAALDELRKHPTPGNAVNVVLAGIGFLPLFGDWFKGTFKKLLGSSRRARKSTRLLAEEADELLAGIRHTTSDRAAIREVEEELGREARNLDPRPSRKSVRPMDGEVHEPKREAPDAEPRSVERVRPTSEADPTGTSQSSSDSAREAPGEPMSKGDRKRRLQPPFPPHRPSQIPGGWSGLPNRKKSGTRFIDPKNEGNRVRIDRGDPDSSFDSQRVDHVVVHRNGRFVKADGTLWPPGTTNKTPGVHIPLREWQSWRQWDSP